MFRFKAKSVLVAMVALAALAMSVCSFAQDDADDKPLGDVARDLRKKSQPVRPVIDDDNLTQVMQQNEARQGFGSSLRYLMSGDSKLFGVAAPDVNCSLAFTANVKSLLSTNQYSQMDLPLSDLSKLEGPAAIEGDALTVSIFNATTWHVSEIAVALTVVKKPVSKESASNNEQGTEGSADSVPKGNSLDEVRPEKKPDVTLLYRMRAAAPPWMRSVFSAPLNLELAPGDEWHWAIVQAKGYPPQDSTPSTIVSGAGPAKTIPVSAVQANEAPTLPQN